MLFVLEMLFLFCYFYIVSWVNVIEYRDILLFFKCEINHNITLIPIGVKAHTHAHTRILRLTYLHTRFH